MKKNRDLDVGIPCIVHKMMLIMKILTCLLFIGLSTVSARTHSQVRLSVSVEKVTLAEAFKQITQLTGYEFVYSSNELSRFNNVSVHAKDAELEKVLAECLKGTDLWYVMENNIIVISPKVSRPGLPQHNYTAIEGYVYDKNGELLPGVTVLQKGSSIGVSTDAKGHFSISLPAGTDIVLRFSFIGMKSVEVKVKDNKPLKITMEEDIKAIDEVVVNGIFEQNRNSYTGSVTTIKGEDILSVSQTNLFKALAILTPGLRIVENNEQGSNPNHIPELIIRGTTSIASNAEVGLNSPLIILDGVEISLEQLYDLDIFEIERVDVLKDAAATAIYGEKAANGVIVVERKRVTDSKLKVRYNFVPNIQFADVSSFNLCNAEQKLEVERLAGLYETIDGSMDEAYNDRLKLIRKGASTDWISKPVRNSYSFNHSLNFTGRGNGMDYSVSARYGDTHGVMKGDLRENLGVGFYFSYHFEDKLTVSFRSDFSRNVAKDSPYGNFKDYAAANPYDVPKDEYGVWYKEFQNIADSYGGSDATTINPLYEASLNSFNKSSSKSFNNSINARWDILKGFYVAANANYSISDNQSDIFVSPESKSFLKEMDPAKKGSYAKSGNESNSWSAQGNLCYSYAFDSKGTILTTHVGGTINRSVSKGYNFMGVGFLKPTLTDINFTTQYPTGHPSGMETISAEVGVFGDMNFILRNKYFASASYRTSGSSRFGANNRFSPFWSAGLGWNIHNEEFFKKQSICTSARLRGSMGYTGSVNFEENQAITTYEYAPENAYWAGIGANPITMGNEDLKWQTTVSYNAGLNVSFLNNRLDINFDIYKQHTKDQLLTIGIPPSAGITSVVSNFGESINKGFEISLSGSVIKTKNVIWRITYSTSHNENKLLKLSNALLRQNQNNKFDNTIVAPKVQLEEGESASAIYAVRSLGIDPATGKEVFIKKDGSYTFTYDPNDKVALGDITPWSHGSIYTTFVWKRLSISAAMTYTLGGDIYNSTRAGKIENIDLRKNVDARVFTQRWKKPGDIVYYTGLVGKSNSFGHTQRFIERKNELYLSSLNISYDLNPRWVKPIGLKRLSLGVTFSDVGRLSTVKFERGTDYPYARGFNFSVSPTF